MLSVKDEMCKCGEHAASISSSAIGSGRAIKKNSSLCVSGPNPSLRSRLPSQGLNTATENGHYSSQHNTPVMGRSVEPDTVLSAVNIAGKPPEITPVDRKSTRLNSSHTVISYAVFCLKKKKQKIWIQ